jgi:vacuolar protein sorting-associated protein 16
MASFLRLSVSPVLSHWAAEKVSQAQGQGDESDDEIVRVVVERLKGQTDVGCADVASKAWNVGKTVLATKVRLSPPQSLSLVAQGLD